MSEPTNADLIAIRSEMIKILEGDVRMEMDRRKQLESMIDDFLRETDTASSVMLPSDFQNYWHKQSSQMRMQLKFLQEGAENDITKNA